MGMTDFLYRDDPDFQDQLQTRNNPEPSFRECPDGMSHRRLAYNAGYRAGLFKRKNEPLLYSDSDSYRGSRTSRAYYMLGYEAGKNYKPDV
jgi:hypothetical protein